MTNDNNARSIYKRTPYTCPEIDFSIQSLDWKGIYSINLQTCFFFFFLKSTLLPSLLIQFLQRIVFRISNPRNMPCE